MLFTLTLPFITEQFAMFKNNGPYPSEISVIIYLQFLICQLLNSNRRVTKKNSVIKIDLYRSRLGRHGVYSYPEQGDQCSPIKVQMARRAFQKKEKFLGISPPPHEFFPACLVLSDFAYLVLFFTESVDWNLALS